MPNPDHAGPTPERLHALDAVRGQNVPAAAAGSAAMGDMHAHG
jgi:hypothetical protein